MSIIKKISNAESIIWIWKIDESLEKLIDLTNQTTDIKNEIKKSFRADIISLGEKDQKQTLESLQKYVKDLKERL